jgi:hypothetical protein
MNTKRDQTCTSVFQCHILECSVSIHGDPDSASNGVTESGWVRRWARSTIDLILALNETVCDSEDGVDNDGVDSFRYLVLYME